MNDAGMSNDEERARGERHLTLLGAALRNEDDLGAVIRGAIFIEDGLRTAIEARLANPDAIENLWQSSLTYDRRIDWALALGTRLSPELVQALRFFGRMRNKLAHHLATALTEPEVNDLVGRLPEAAREWVLDCVRQESSAGWRAKLQYSIVALFLALHRHAIPGREDAPGPPFG